MPPDFQSEFALTSAPSGSALSPFRDDPRALEIASAMKARNPKADPLRYLPDVHPERIPRHVAIIMDGNGRWANQRGFPRPMGHRAGAASVRTAVEHCGNLGIEVLTLYSFSMENWKRPREEVQALMELCATYLEGEREALVRENVRFRVIGRRGELPREIVAGIELLEAATSGCTSATLCLAINYGSRAEIVDAARALAERVKAGTLDPAAIDEAAFAGSLYTAGLPDPDLLVRTAGEMRVSNYLLWQISYAEIHVTPTFWPDFGPSNLEAAVREYASRSRRFGGLDSPR
jgi:undecaprenyl diphosphate synthase